MKKNDQEAGTAYRELGSTSSSFCDDIFEESDATRSSNQSTSYTTTGDEDLFSLSGECSSSEESLQFQLDGVPNFFSKPLCAPPFKKSKPLNATHTSLYSKPKPLVQIYLVNAWNTLQERLQEARINYINTPQPSWFQSLIAEKGVLYHILSFFKVFDDYLEETLLLCREYENKDLRFVNVMTNAELSFKQESQHIYEKSQEIPIYTNNQVKNTFDSLLSSQELSSGLLKAVIAEIQTANLNDIEPTPIAKRQGPLLLDSEERKVSLRHSI